MKLLREQTLATSVTHKVEHFDKRSPSPLCTGVNPQRCVRKAATAEGGAGASIPAASSPPVRVEVMKIGRLTCALRCTAKGGGASSRKRPNPCWEATTSGVNRWYVLHAPQAYFYAVASLLLLLSFTWKAKKKDLVDYSKMQKSKELGRDWD